MNYTQNDNELIYLLNEDSDHYRYILFEKYKPIIISIVNDYYDRFNGLYIDYDDLFQEGLIGFSCLLVCPRSPSMNSCASSFTSIVPPLFMRITAAGILPARRSRRTAAEPCSARSSALIFILSMSFLVPACSRVPADRPL